MQEDMDGFIVGSHEFNHTEDGGLSLTVNLVGPKGVTQIMLLQMCMAIFEKIFDEINKLEADDLTPPKDRSLH